MTKVDWGIQSIKFMPPVGGGAFPDFNATTGVHLLNLIVIDSYSETEEDNSTNEIEWEDTHAKLILPGSVGKKTIMVQTNDLSEEQYKYFKGYVDGTGQNAGYLVEDPNHNDTTTQAMQVITRAVGDFPARQHEYTPVQVIAKKAGTTGKNGLPNLTLTINRQPNFSSDGGVIGGYRFRDVPASTEG